MLKASHFTPKDYLRQPWKNGLGETLEIAKNQENPFSRKKYQERIPIKTQGYFSTYAKHTKGISKYQCSQQGRRCIVPLDRGAFASVIE